MLKKLRLAYDNLKFNNSQTIMSIIVISIAVTSIMLFRGYINYSSYGMKISFIGRFGALQIAHRDFWADDTEIKPILKNKDKVILSEMLDNIYGIDSYQELLSLNGLIGTAYRSRFFVGDAYEYFPNGLYQELVGDHFDENGIIIGDGLSSFLLVEDGDFVSLLGQGNEGMAFISLPIGGRVKTGTRELDNILGVMTLNIARSFYGMTDEFDRLRIELVNLDQLSTIKNQINDKLENTPYEVKDWLFLNPIYEEINSLNESTALWMNIIFMLFIVVSITQMLQMNYFQRMRELGTLQAIGLTPTSVFILLFFETLLLAVFSITVGIINSYIVAFIIDSLGIEFTPPMSTVSYPISMIFYITDFIMTSLGVGFVVVLSGIYPAYKAVSKPVAEVMKYV